MFKQSTRDSINGWGHLLRFATPILITIALFILGGMKEDAKEVRREVKELAFENRMYSTNHLEHHAKFEVDISERMSSMEATMKNWSWRK